MDIFFGSVLFSPFSMFESYLSLPSLCPWIVVGGLDVLLWHGWLPGLNGLLGNKPWALSFGELASFHLERCLGSYPVDFSAAWTPPDYWDADDIALEMPDHPNIWTDGSRDDYSSIGGFEVAGAGT